MGEKVSSFLGEQAKRGFSVVAVLGNHALVERPLLLLPVIAFFAEQDLQPGRLGQRTCIGDGVGGGQVRWLAAAPPP